MTFKDVAEVIGATPAIIAFFKPFPSWFKPSGAVEPNITIAAVGFSIAACIATWVFFGFVEDPVGTWSRATRLKIYKRAIAVLVAAVADMIAYVLLVRLYPYPSVIVDIIQVILWAAFFGLISIALVIFVVFQKSRASAA